jgi:serine/threonine protein kinase
VLLLIIVIHIAIVSCLNHINLVELKGVMLEPYPRMVLEYLPCGDLCHFLHPQAGESIACEDFSWDLRLAFAWDIAKGMNYLQTRSPPVIHRDLRSPNVFVCGTGTAHS